MMNPRLRIFFSNHLSFYKIQYVKWDILNKTLLGVIPVPILLQKCKWTLLDHIHHHYYTHFLFHLLHDRKTMVQDLNGWGLASYQSLRLLDNYEYHYWYLVLQLLMVLFLFFLCVLVLQTLS